MIMAATLAGCFRDSLVSFRFDASPQVLVPAGRAGIVDGRARFREIWCTLREDHGRSLPNDRPCGEALLLLGGEGPPTGRPVGIGTSNRSLRVVVVPGLLGECFRHLASTFADGLEHLATHGYRTDVIWVGGRSSSRRNAEQIRKAVMTMTLATEERLLLIGHSKGAVDILEALVAYPEIVARIAGVVSVAGAINGSPLADGLYEFHRHLIDTLPLSNCEEGDGGAFASLSRTERLSFVATASLPATVRFFSVSGIVPWAETSRLLRPSARRLAQIDPSNDGQLLWTDTVIPGSTLLGYVRADHWAIALPFSRMSPSLAATVIDHNAFPREILLEAIVRTVEDSL
jgi:pimeloyl-ACP methyl ester carboxylesterase